MPNRTYSTLNSPPHASTQLSVRERPKDPPELEAGQQTDHVTVVAAACQHRGEHEFVAELAHDRDDDDVVQLAGTGQL